MNEQAFDYLQEYIDHMLPERRARLMRLPVYRAYLSERRRLSSRMACMLARKEPFAGSGLAAQAQKLEALGRLALAAARRLDPYGD